MTVGPLFEKDKPHEFTSSKEFLKALEDSAEQESLLHYRANWIFRGQASADWDLTPHAMRQGMRLVRGKEVEMPELVTWTTPGQNEWHSPLSPKAAVGREFDLVVRGFLEIVDGAGLEVPGDAYDLRDRDTRGDPRTLANFPLPRYRAMFALAQHYGIPTRLLDWSRRPLVAAYFACVEAAKQQREGTPSEGAKLAVWALNESVIHELGRWDPGPIIVTAPTASNPNLRAQAGVFTLVRFRTERKAVKPIPTLDGLLSRKRTKDLPKEMPPEVRGMATGPILHKFTLPAQEAPRLLHLLARRGITAASVYPGLYGAAKALRERLWHRTS